MKDRSTNKEEMLKIHIEYQDLRADIEGSYEIVWRSVNEFLKKMAQILTPEEATITTKGKDAPNIILSLRNRGFFDQRRLSRDVYEKFEELGKTDITKEAVLMALKSLVVKGILKRSKKGNKFEYYAPYIE